MTDRPFVRISLDDYLAFVSQPENAQRTFELIDGEFVEKMPSYTPSYIAGLILTYLNL
jgi:Uma2 family endonuclease